jgi:hypothetical protein
MSVMAVTAIASSMDPAQRQSSLSQDLQGLGKALNSGNLVSAQKALDRFQADLQSIRPQQSGVRASAEVNPQSTLRNDAQSLQSALDAGDLALTEEAFFLLQQDTQQVSAIQASQDTQLSNKAASLSRAVSGDEQSVLNPDSAGSEDQSGGTSIDVYA